jgi:probable HAF family extracellular repeat protein
MRRFGTVGVLVVLIGLSTVVAACAVGSSGSGASRWVITDLGTLGRKESVAAAINSRGQIVGRSYTDRDPYYPGEAFLWEQGTMRDLGTLGGDCPTSDATAINDQGQVVGSSGTLYDCSPYDYSERPALWESGKAKSLAPSGEAVAINGRGQILIGDSDMRFASLWGKGKLVHLDALPGGKGLSPVALNDGGQVVGYSDMKGVLGWHAFTWRDGRTQDLGTLAGDKVSEAVAINNNGTVAGNSYPTYHALLDEDYPGEAKPQVRAVVWQDGKIHALGTLGGTASHANAISPDSRVVGWATRNTGDRHAFLWQNGRIRDLGTVPGRRQSEAVAINTQGVIVGNAFTLSSEKQALRAFVWRKGVLTDLGTLAGGKESAAVAINDHNQIIGWSTTKNGQKHAVLWTQH